MGSGFHKLSPSHISIKQTKPIAYGLYKTSLAVGSGQIPRREHPPRWAAHRPLILSGHFFPTCKRCKLGQLIGRPERQNGHILPAQLAPLKVNWTWLPSISICFRSLGLLPLNGCRCCGKARVGNQRADTRNPPAVGLFHHCRSATGCLAEAPQGTAAVWPQESTGWVDGLWSGALKTWKAYATNVIGNNWNMDVGEKSGGIAEVD